MGTKKSKGPEKLCCNSTFTRERAYGLCQIHSGVTDFLGVFTELKDESYYFLTPVSS